MKANPGGQIAASEVIGRDKLIERLWRVLERQSLVLTAERRMGKTCVVKKMVAEAPQGMLPIYHDLEGIRTPLEFVETILRDVEGYLSGLKQTASGARKLLNQLAGIEIGGFGGSIKIPESVAPHWKTILTKTIEDLVEHQDRTVVLFWDELPLVLDDIKKSSGEDVAMEVLDTLRSLRQNHTGIRTVFTGSIGLHNVLTSLKRAGYANDSTNDMNTVEVPPLSPEDARELALRLFEGEGLQVDDEEAVSQAVADLVDGIPYFIHHIIDQLVHIDGRIDVTTVSDVLDTSLTDPQDAWHLRHYRERLDTYYADDERPFALNMLDVFSLAEQPLRFDEAFNLLKSHLPTEDSEMARDVLSLLQRDHYVIQQTDGTYRFRFPIIQRAWRLQRGLRS